MARFKRLFIAEKPSVGKTLAAHLDKHPKQDQGFVIAGNDVVTWCVGHLLQSFEPPDYDESLREWTFDTLPIIPEIWKVKPTEAGSKQIPIIKHLISQSDVVVHAGDPDREGQLIVDEVLDYLGYHGPTSRLWLAALDERSIDAALGAITDNSVRRPLGMAALARTKCDWTVGMNLTRAYTIAARRSRVFRGKVTVGRVQTPTLAMVDLRDWTIEKFHSVGFFEVMARLQSADGGQWTALWQPREGLKGMDPDGRLLDKAIAQAVAGAIKGTKGTIESYEDVACSESPPLGHSLSTLQMEASQKFGMSAKRTLEIAQALYENHKATTYPRTDCRYLPASQHADAARVLNSIGKRMPHLGGAIGMADPTHAAPLWNDKKITAHHAIIPTGVGDLSAFSQEEKQVFELICRRYVAQFLPDLAYRQVSITTRCKSELFKANGRRVTEQGWSVLYRAAKKEGDEPEELPLVKAGDEATVVDTRVKEGKTKPPKYFDDGSLIRAMSHVAETVSDPTMKAKLKESAGIGTEATRANIIDDLVKKEYLMRDSRWIKVTPLGRAIVRGLPNELRTPLLTAEFETGMQGVERGTDNPTAFIGRQQEFVRRIIRRTAVLKDSPFAIDANIAAMAKDAEQRRKGSYGKGRRAGAGRKTSVKPRRKTSTAATDQESA